jgi:hypothetical protein
MYQPAQKGSGRQNDCRGLITKSRVILNTDHPVCLDHQSLDHRLFEVKVCLRLNNALHGDVVSRLVVLGTGRMHGRTLFRVQSTVLNGGLIGNPGHLTAQSVYFLNQLPFCHTPDGRTARHGSHLVQINGH